MDKKKNILVIDALLYCADTVRFHQTEKLLNGHDTATCLIERASRLNNIDSRVFLAPAGFPEDIMTRFAEASYIVEQSDALSDMQKLLVTLGEVCEKNKADNVVLAWFDSPFLEPTISNAVIQLQLDNLCEYSFADNLPDGLSVECMSKEFLKDIIKSSPKRPELLSRKVFDNMDADINQYYVEVWLPDDDISLKRIEFHSNSKRNNVLINNFLAKNKSVPDYSTIVELVRGTPEIFYIHPRYVEIELTTESNEKPFYLPAVNRPKGSMDLAVFKKIVEDFTSEFDDIIIALTGAGDPLLYKEIIPAVHFVLNEVKVQSLIVETNGVWLTDEMIAAFTPFMPSRLQFIFKIDAYREETYRTVRGGELVRVKTNIEKFLAASDQNKFRSFIQFTKLKENIDEMEDFYRFWEGKGVQIIIQKYNSFAGQLPNRTVADLSPLDRMPCWHLQRDLNVFWDGRVSVCKQDFDGKHVVGDLKTESVCSIRGKLSPFYIENYFERFQAYPLCMECDEWYTYNF